MTLQKYEIIKADNPMSDRSMNFCLREARDIIKNPGPSRIRRLIELQREYVHYRDAAIKQGLNESIYGGPKKIRVPKEIADEIDRINARNRKISKLKQRFGRS